MDYNQEYWNLQYPKYCHPKEESSKCSINPSETKSCEPLRSTVHHFVIKILTEWKPEQRHKPTNMAFSINHIAVKHDDTINLLFKYFYWDICGNCQGLQVLLHFFDFKDICSLYVWCLNKKLTCCTITLSDGLLCVLYLLFQSPTNCKGFKREIDHWDQRWGQNRQC